MPGPIVNIQDMAQEIKNFIEKKKFDCVDYGYVQIEIYPPNSEDYPEVRAFAAQWLKFFDDAEKVLSDATEEPGQLTFTQVLAKYDPGLADLLAVYDGLTAEVEKAVNNDTEFWTKLREIILPLYEKSPYYEQWKEGRWKSISLSFDPTPLEVVTTQMWTNKETGERIRGEVVRKTEYPAGFVVKIN